MTRRTGAFTMIEVLAVLLLLAIGLGAAIGMMLFAARRAEETRMLQLAMATAMTVAYDPTPLLDPVVAASWSAAGVDLDDAATADQLAQTRGCINGFYVIRREMAARDDLIARDAGAGIGYGRLARVHVSVFVQSNGAEITTYSCLRFLRRGTP